MKEKSAIAQMYYDGRGMNENCTISREAEEMAGVVHEKYNMLKLVLQPQKDIWQLFEDFENALCDYHEKEAADHYAEGFKFGLLIGVEANSDK